MRRWPLKPLGEVCEINPRLAPAESPSPDVQVSFIPMAAIDEGFGLVSRPETRGYGEVAKGYTSFRDGDVLFAKITPCMQNGKAAIARSLRGGLGFGSTEFHVLRPRPGLLSEWVFAFIRQPSFRSAAEASFTGSAGQQRVPAEFLRKTFIPVPPLAEQERLISLLDQASGLRKLRARADQRSAELIPALFHEMFGDPVTNSYKWPTNRLADVCDSKGGIKAGPFGSSLKKEFYTLQGPRVYGQEQVISGSFDVGDYHISESKYAEMSVYAVSPGDLLISLVGTIGAVTVVPDGVEPGIINPRLLRIRLRKDVLHPCYLANVLTHTSVRELLAGIAGGSTMSVLNAGLLKRLAVPVPPLSLQQKFSDRVAEIRKLEANQAASRLRLEDLFQSSLHHAFEGEL